MFDRFSNGVQRAIIGAFGGFLFSIAFLAAAVGPAQADLAPVKVEAASRG